MPSTRFTALTALALAAACSGAQTKAPIVTTSGDGRTVSASGDSAAERGTSFVRFVNAVPGNANLGLQADRRNLFDKVAYKSVTEYQEIGDNRATFSLRDTGDGGELAANSEMMSDGFRYTLIALSDEKGGAVLHVVRDELIPATGKAGIRIFHAAAGLEDVDLAVVGESTPVFDRVRFGTEAAFKDVEPMTVEFEIRSYEGRADLVRLPVMTLKAGRAYTIILAGVGPRGLTAITFDDAPVAPKVAAVVTVDPR